MRVLLLDPADSLVEWPWGKSQWDMVIDLGWAGRHIYKELSREHKCAVRSWLDFGNWASDVGTIRQILSFGSGELIDAEGVDWWDLLSLSRFQGLYEFVLLQTMAREIPRGAEICVSRPNRLAGALEALLGVDIDPIVATEDEGVAGSVRRAASALRRLTPSQMIAIAFDKWDADYRLRRIVSRRRRKPAASGPRVLLPSAYRNVSRVVAAYASLLPQSNFLLATTRKDGAIPNLPRQVECVPLAAYAPLPRNAVTEREIESLASRWRMLRDRLSHADEPLLVHAAGLWDDFERSLRIGLRVRDAWKTVLEEEEIEAVLCGDEHNPFTRLPVLLAKKRGVRTIYCSHGALDSNIFVRGVCSDVYLAKGEMELDYLVNHCGVAPEKTVVGAAPGPVGSLDRAEGTHIVFFSEPYELYAGRTESLYREVLPALCAVARAHGRRLKVKLHPFESLKSRLRLVNRILTDGDRELVEVTAEPMSERLVRQVWFSLTVESSVAVECALAGVPSFLCGWFDFDLYSYGRQYEKFGAARILHGPDEIAQIPQTIGGQPIDEKIRQGLHRSISPQEFESVLMGEAEGKRSANTATPPAGVLHAR